MKKVFLLSSILVAISFFLFLQTVLAEDTLRVEKIVICKGVDQRTPLGIGNVFSVDTKKLFCFTRIVGATEKTTITHRWLLNGELKSSVKLPVASEGWRTWSAKTIEPSEAGDWVVEVVSENGRELATIIFFVQ